MPPAIIELITQSPQQVDYKVVYLDDDNDYRVDTLQDKTLPTVGAWKSVTEVEPNEEVEGGHVGGHLRSSIENGILCVIIVIK